LESLIVKTKDLMRPFYLILAFALFSCSGSDEGSNPEPQPNPFQLSDYLNLNWSNLPEYVNISYPVHYSGPVLQNVNVPLSNPITNKGASLGRVLFYDTKLSINNTISCASCHNQSSGFTDSAIVSTGVNGTTPAHSMRLLNSVFYTGNSMFWDKRAPSLEIQTTMPIKDHIEMGFSSANGGMTTLLNKMNQIPYYPYLFNEVFGTPDITEDRIQKVLAQFIRSMISTHSKFDSAYAEVFSPQAPNGGIGASFPQFTPNENAGKNLFLLPKPQGLGCAGCHIPPTFALAANSLSNGLDANETRIFKSPSLKNSAVGPYMHDGRFASLDEVIEHYNSGILNGPALDNRLKGPNNTVQQLNMTPLQKQQLRAFLETLTDAVITQDPKFSNPHL
jgi:cytochrome c peroxidase